MEYPEVAIIILNWNGWKDTIECLESLRQIEYSNYKVIIVDNGSKDESLDMIRAYCQGKFGVNSNQISTTDLNGSESINYVEYTRKDAKDAKINLKNGYILIKNEKNYGYAEGNNIAIRYALKALCPDYLLLLNNDTVVDKNFLRKAIEVAERKKEIGILGPKTYYYNFKGRKDIITFAGGKLEMWRGKPSHIGENEIDKGQYDEIKQVDYAEGSALLVKKEVLNKVGLLDAFYFAYWEELDFCIRAYKAGYECVYVPESKIWHKVSSSSTSRMKHYYMARNRFIFLRRHLKTKQYLFFLLYFFGFEFWIFNIFSLLIDKDIEKCIYSAKGVFHGIRTEDKVLASLH